MIGGSLADQKHSGPIRRVFSGPADVPHLLAFTASAAQLNANDLFPSCLSQVTEYLNSQESAKTARVSPSPATVLFTHV